MPMSNNTFEDYKNAIKAKYREEADGEFSNYLSSPTTANLRKLCIKRFESNTNNEDLNGFKSFFDFPFDGEKKNLFGDDEMNKLEAVKRFFLGKTENPADDTIQLAAILVDLKPRPFREFRKQIDEEDLQIFDELKDTNISNEKVSKEIKIEIPDRLDEKAAQIQESKSIKSERSQATLNLKPKSKIARYIAIIFVLLGLGTIIHIALKKHCMQWSGDHFEEVSCDFKTEGIGTFTVLEPYDERVINLRKIKVCDTTAFFKNGKAVIWYSKIGDSVEFFNTHGTHPETGRGLKPITHYIINKYVVNH